ncbi:MAG: phosphomannomutase/phosphoglucomutase [Clostridia bacterium]|nr:phosphomannomutase/phosphoglucomutase [Clostridia bacterium]
MNLTSLQNGSDIRGVALCIPGGKPQNLTNEAAVRIGMAFTHWLKKKTGKASPSVSLGRDSRLTGESLLSHIAYGLSLLGADVTSFGMASTPAMFMSTITKGYLFDGAIMITASHLPPERNGFKFFTADGGLEKSDIAEILSIADNCGDIFIDELTPRQVDFMSVYCDMMADFIRKGVDSDDFMHPLKGLHIIVDAGHGAGGFFATNILKSLGANIEGSQFLTPDGNFPAHSPNPEDKKAMESLKKAVLSSKADMGIILDPDVDRAAIVLGDGSEINRNRLIAMLSAIVLRDHPGSFIVTDSITSTGLATYIKAHGGIHRRFKRGYRNVINEALRLNKEGHDCQLAIETSGHGAFLENNFLDDGAYIAAKLIVEFARCRKEGLRINDLLSGLDEPADAIEIRLEIDDPDFAAYGEKVLSELTAICHNTPGIVPETENYEGIRCNVPEFKGWFLLRMSLHDPVMPLNIESDIKSGVNAIKDIVASMLKDFDKLRGW